MNKGLALDLALLTIPLALFLSLSVYQLEVRGLYYDEALDAVPAMQVVLGQKVELVREAGVLIGQQALPMMVSDYQGAVQSYLLMPFFALLGVSVVSLRLMPVVASAATLVLAYFFARSFFNRPVAFLTILLTAVQPSFIFWTQQGIHVCSVMGLLAISSLYSFWRWYRGGNSAFFILGCFLLGLGLSAKLLFLWWIAALGLAYLLLHPRGLLAQLVRLWPRRSAVGATFDNRQPAPRWSWLDIGPKQAFLGLIAGALGAWMILLYNLQTQGTLQVLSLNLRETSYGVKNFDLWPNLLTRLHSFEVLLNGGGFWFLGGIFSNRPYPYILAALVGLMLGLFLSARGGPARRFWRRGTFILLLIVLVLVESTATMSGLWPTHLFLLYPLPQMLIGLTLYLLYQSFTSKAITLGIASLLVVFLIGSDLWVDRQYHRVLADTGGWATHSDAINRLAQFLDERQVTEPMAMDWGIKTSVQVLTQGRVNPQEIFFYSVEPPDLFTHWLYGALTKADRYYLFHTDEFTIYPRFQAFQAMAQKMDKELLLEATIGQRDEHPVYLVYYARSRK